MNGVKSSAGNLRDKVEAYITNGRYDPNKSQRIAEDYKNMRLTIEERRKATAPSRRKVNEESKAIFTRFETLVSSIKAPSNEEHYHSLRRVVRRFDPKLNRSKLRVPSALMQTNKLKKDVETRNSNSNVRGRKPSVTEKRRENKYHTTYSCNTRVQV